ncbi:MAG: diguanylate cyclase [Clostridia bacterium]|jgi:diguanylate cyclase (GGDEF)-like protein|nr:diguanylate cyclase [Clostridia bacterium]MBT7122798.1 diguanylate cyclase [Clostridia bacterium]
MGIVVKIDILVFSFIMLAFLLVYYILNAPQKTPAKRMFVSIIVSLMLNTTLAALACIPNGINEPWAISMNTWVRSALLVSAYLPVAAWMAYIDHKIFNNFDNIKKRGVFYLIPFYVAAIMVALNSVTGLMFTIEPGNVFTRQFGVIVVTIIMYLMVIGLLYVAQKLKSRINTKHIKVVFGFMMLPFIASILQVPFPDLIFLWPAFAFATFMAFLLLEKDAMLKDSLTKLNTRVALEARVKSKLRRHEPFSLIMIDLDEFKQVNDMFGHKVGDDALMVVASILEDSVKRTDMVCRYGGDEFLILVESPRPHAARYIKDRVKARISAFNKKGVKPYKIAMSFGLKFYDHSNVNLKHLLSEVDQLMYAEKEKNKRAAQSRSEE